MLLDMVKPVAWIRGPRFRGKRRETQSKFNQSHAEQTETAGKSEEMSETAGE